MNLDEMHVPDSWFSRCRVLHIHIVGLVIYESLAFIYLNIVQKIMDIDYVSCLLNFLNDFTIAN